MSNSPLCHVVLLNDDDTPMDFVVQVLQDVFGLDHDDACTLMFGVHHNGKGICGTFPRKQAEARVNDVLALAGKHRQPLKCILEEPL
jgi:ATP-dependent Clp protease adaptor protein ClpS